ncbi:coat protein [Passion fruit yellow mosaic virus]|uniref:Capsid protein n=1 Tax=Passion fruit yellow mosaic virus TaxID=185692 RepID=Q8QY74_9VIRU|nr:coat protein [Passion fruit yellow mosaic virus]AAL76049.1 coat protein [Passion fruit yellow mosaic virus]
MSSSSLVTSLVSQQTPINTKSDSIPLEPGNAPPVIKLPFQTKLASLGTAEVSDSVSIAANAAVSSLATPYRHARLTSLVATIHPNHLSPSNPTTVSLVWVPFNSTATSSDILNVFGGQSFCIGGAVNSLAAISVPCNLTNVNPVIKSSKLPPSHRLFPNSTPRLPAHRSSSPFKEVPPHSPLRSQPHT